MAFKAATSSGVNQTNIGVGITESMSLFDHIQSSGSRAIILLSDGAGKISPQVKQKISERLAEKKLNLYWIVLREPDDISIFTKGQNFAEGSAPASVELDQYFKTIQIKYKAYEADNPLALQAALQDIDAREKNIIQYAISIPGHDYAGDLVQLALALCVALVQATLPLIGAGRGHAGWMALAGPAGIRAGGAARSQSARQPASGLSHPVADSDPCGQPSGDPGFGTSARRARGIAVVVRTSCMGRGIGVQDI